MSTIRYVRETESDGEEEGEIIRSVRCSLIKMRYPRSRARISITSQRAHKNSFDSGIK